MELLWVIWGVIPFFHVLFFPPKNDTSYFNWKIWIIEWVFATVIKALPGTLMSHKSSWILIQPMSMRPQDSEGQFKTRVCCPWGRPGFSTKCLLSPSPAQFVCKVIHGKCSLSFKMKVLFFKKSLVTQKKVKNSYVVVLAFTTLQIIPKICFAITHNAYISL